MVTSYIRGASLRRWLARADCPAVIKACKTLFDKAFSPKSEDLLGDDGNDLGVVTLPSDLRNATNLLKASLMARCRFRGFIYSRSSTHLGNSLVLFHKGGDRRLSPVPGCIKHIYRHQSTTYLAVQRYEDIEHGTADPFAKYPYFPAKLYSSTLADPLEIIQPEWIHSHFALWEFSPSQVVVLSLSHVCMNINFNPSHAYFFSRRINIVLNY